MKPAWEQLGSEFENSKTVLIGNVDCTVEQDVCSKYGVRGYPTIKYFTGATAADGDSYDGGRTFDDLKKFADENLGPSCDAAHKDLCTPEKLEELEEAMKMTQEERDSKIKEANDAIEAADKYFKDEVSKLQAKYEELTKEKEEKTKEAQGPLKILRAASVPADDAAAKEEL
jgi:thioredoxin-like negative regulator of GroEL